MSCQSTDSVHLIGASITSLICPLIFLDKFVLILQCKKTFSPQASGALGVRVADR